MPLSLSLGLGLSSRNTGGGARGAYLLSPVTSFRLLSPVTGKTLRRAS